MIKDQKKIQYDLEDRTFEFARRVRCFLKDIKRSLSNIEDSKQLIRSSGSVGANYIEANEALSKKDFIFRIKICRKEAKESRYWLRLLQTGGNNNLDKIKQKLEQESKELTKIFAAILNKSQK